MRPLKYRSSTYLTQNLHVVASGCKKTAKYNKINLINTGENARLSQYRFEPR